MNRVIIKVRDRNQINDLEKFGVILFKSPVLNVVTLEVKSEQMDSLIKEVNVVSCEPEPTGQLMF